MKKNIFEIFKVTIDIRECITAHRRRPSALFWLSSYVARHCLAVAPQSGAHQNFYCTVFYITLNSNWEAQRGSKNLKKNVEDRVRSQN
jgi:hypothetical protein